MNQVLENGRGGLIVSCQAYPDEPMLDPRTMTQMAQAAVSGGAVGIRAKGLDHLVMMLAVLDVPLIGLVKVGDRGVYITPTLSDCLADADAGADIVALDGTRLLVPMGDLGGDALGPQDCEPRHLGDGRWRVSRRRRRRRVPQGRTVGTTLAGNTGERPSSDGPDWEFIETLIGSISAP